MTRNDLVTITMPAICAHALLDALHTWIRADRAPRWDQETFDRICSLQEELKQIAGDPIPDYQR